MVTTQQMWLSALVAAAILVTLAVILHRRVRSPFPPRLPLALLLGGMLFFGILYGWAARTYWDSCYGAVLPSWAKWVAPMFGTAWGGLGAVFWRVAQRARPTRPLPLFLLLGGLHSLPGHLHGIYGRGLLAKCRIIQGISAPSALTFGLFEFAVYWAIVLLVAHEVLKVKGR